MKKSTIWELREMSDSREVLSEWPHHFVAWFGYGLIALIAVALIWSFWGHIDYYVRAQGEVRPNEPVSVIRSTVTGRVLETNLSEGQQVRKGDLLFTMDVETQLNTAAILESQFDTVNQEITNLEKYRDSIIQSENLFDATEPNESDYYYRYEKYVTDRDVAIEQVKNANLDFTKLLSDAKTAESNAQNNSQLIKKEIDGLDLLLQSINQGQNLIPKSDAKQYAIFLDYQLNLDRYAALIVQQEIQRTRAEALYAVGGISEKQMESALDDLDSTIRDRERYKNEFRLGIINSIDSLDNNLNDLNSSIKSANVVIESYTDREYSEGLVTEKSKLDALTQTSDAMFNLQNNAYALQKDLGGIQLSISEARVITPIDGTVSLRTEINVGDFLQSGTEIATIIPGTNGELKVVLAVPNADIADMKEGQLVHYRLQALPFREYGELDGRITKISTDSQRDNTGQSYYMVEAELSDTILIGREGTPESIKVGMMVEVRVITKNVRIIHWVLEKLDFIDG